MSDQNEMEDTTAVVDCDFLIVGAGSSGCVLASRLVRQGLKVLLVEKGPADDRRLSKLVRRPSQALAAAFSGDALSEVFFTEPQAGLDNRRLHAFRGRGGGGSSNVNAGLYCRGSKKDYEENWPWKLEEIEASFKSIESELTLEELPPTGTVAPSCNRMLEEIGFERPPPTESGESDEPTWTMEGLGGCAMKRTTTKGGERQSAWSAFVKPVTTMPNLRIKDDATVSRVIIEGGRAVGIEVVESSPSWRGVGTQVGEHLHDHFIIPSINFSKLPMGEADYVEDGIHGQVYFSRELPAPSTGSVYSSSRGDGGGDGDNIGTESTTNPRPSAVVGMLYVDGGGLARTLHLGVGLLLTQRGLLWAVLRTVVMTLCRVVKWFPPIARILRNTRAVLMCVTTVQSRGTVRLSSADAAAPPVIDPAYLSHPQDQQAACAVWHTVRRAKRETPTGKAVFGDELQPGKMYNYGNDDESFLRFARENCMPFYHPVGTCRMGKGAEDSVVSVDSLRVHGVSGLRVADASVAPRAPSTPTQAMAMMIGDRAASIALNDRAAKQQIQMRLVESANKSIN